LVVANSGDYPDIYADGFSVTVSPVSATLTLTRTQPTGQPGNHEEPTEVVGRVRLSPVMAKAIADALNQLAAQATMLATQQSAAKN
jgi:hypothetical protein